MLRASTIGASAGGSTLAAIAAIGKNFDYKCSHDRRWDLALSHQSKVI
jgi:hypothetical protein